MELTLNPMTGPSWAVALNIETRLPHDNHVVAEKRIAQITATKNNESSLRKTVMLVNMSIADKEYTMDINVPSRVKIPINRWDKENMWVKDIPSVSNIHGIQPMQEINPVLRFKPLESTQCSSNKYLGRFFTQL